MPDNLSAVDWIPPEPVSQRSFPALAALTAYVTWVMSIVFVISAPSGAGKSTLVERLRPRDSNLDFATSVTTRPPRDREIDGEAYCFVSADRFKAMIDRDELMEWAEVFGHLYGTPTAAVKRAFAKGKDLLLDIDVQGAALLLKKLPDAVTIFVLPPSRAALEQRLRDRCSDDEAAISKRLGEASREVAVCGAYDHIVINEDVEDAVSRLHGILIAERSRRANMQPRIAPILQSFGIQQEQDQEVNS